MPLKIKTSKREEFLDITSLVKEKIKKFEFGVLHIFVQHSSAGIVINENADKNILEDFTNFLNKLVPRGKWMHDKIDGNCDAHIKALIVGNSVSVPVKDGKLQLGRWQNIFLCEFDGPRERDIFLNFTESKTKDL